jgi:hypothetical protein
VQILIDGVRRPLKPVLPLPHLRRNQRGEKIPAPKRAAELPTPFDVFVERLALELNQDINGEYSTVDKIGKREIDDSVLCRKMDSRFRAISRKRQKAFPFTPCQYNTQDPFFPVCAHFVSPSIE